MVACRVLEEQVVNAHIPFAELLEAIDGLSLDEQEALLQIVRRRMAEVGRKRVAAEIQEAREEFAEGRRHPTTPDDLMNEVKP